MLLFVINIWSGLDNQTRQPGWTPKVLSHQ